ncbi:hypothetical protein [Hymenobacter koreensis]|uniref:Uncharacterized protein n=1 Tax=Hymenobacter koreensis TaxID=1084523 RepID=A0ABP8JJJ1_9BACT
MSDKLNLAALHILNAYTSTTGDGVNVVVAMPVTGMETVTLERNGETKTIEREKGVGVALYALTLENYTAQQVKNPAVIPALDTLPYEYKY